MSDRKDYRAKRILATLALSVAVAALLVLVVVPSATGATQTVRLAPASAKDPSCTVGSGPQFPGYDPVSHEVYVPNYNSGTITILNSTCATVGTIMLPTDSEPVQAVFDPDDNYMFVTDYNLEQVYEISGSKVLFTFTNSMVGDIFSQPWGITYFPLGGSSPGIPGALMIADLGSDTLAGFIPEHPNPGTVEYFLTGATEMVTYDPDDGCLWATEPGNDVVAVVCGGTVQTFPVGTDPRGLDLDLANGYMYVANYDSDNVTVLEGAEANTGVSIGSISGLSEPVGVAWDQATLHIYVTNNHSGKVFVIGGSTGLSVLKKESTSSTSGADGLIYDAESGTMFTTGFDSNKVYLLS